MTAFEEDAHAEAFGKGAGGGLGGGLDGGKGAAEEGGGLGEVGGEEGGTGEEARGEDADGGVVEKARAAGGDHDGVDDEGERGVGLGEVGHHVDEGGVEEHPGLGGAEGEGLGHARELVAQDGGVGALHAADAEGVLGGEGGEGGAPVDAVRPKGAEVGLDAGAAAAVAAGDRHRRRDVLCHEAFLSVAQGQLPPGSPR